MAFRAQNYCIEKSFLNIYRLKVVDGKRNMWSTKTSLFLILCSEVTIIKIIWTVKANPNSFVLMPEL